jgi:hypothetical protein
MTVAVSYVFPNIHASRYNPAAQRFAATYQQFPPGGRGNDLYVIGNGPPLSRSQKELFNPMQAQHFTHNNFGKDIGAFQMIAGVVKCDLMVFFGAHIYFWRAGWLDRLVDAYTTHGPGVYGTWAFHQPLPHIRTTAFACAPELLDSYPRVINDGARYQFEHGDDSLTLWAKRSGFETNLVTWDGCYPMDQWRHVSREEALFYDQWYDGRG